MLGDLFVGLVLSSYATIVMSSYTNPGNLPRVIDGKLKMLIFVEIPGFGNIFFCFYFLYHVFKSEGFVITGLAYGAALFCIFTIRKFIFATRLITDNAYFPVFCLLASLFIFFRQ